MIFDRGIKTGSVLVLVVDARNEVNMSRPAEPGAMKQLCEHVATLRRDLTDPHTRRMVFGLNAEAGDFVRQRDIKTALKVTSTFFQ